MRTFVRNTVSAAPLRDAPLLPRTCACPPSPPHKLRRVTFLTTTALAALLAWPRYGAAEPLGGTVVEGAAAISQSGPVTNINQSSNNAIINWQSFSIGRQETVNFNQPSVTAATLNRVIGNEQSVIAGALNANGRVFLVNSAGILFAKGSQVNVGGLVASTLDISNRDFMAGNYTFSGTSQAAVVNQGRIHAHTGGFVSLLGKIVSNEGVISARLGTVAMASGEKITLNFGGDSLLDVTIDKGTLNGLVSNKRLIKANGGMVILTARAADQVLSAQVNNSGVIQARTMSALKGGGTVRVGKIKLLAQGGTVKVSGKLDASAPKGGDGGFIETSGDKVTVADDTVITTKAASGRTGTWLVDPTNFVIAASGGDITGATLSNQLESNNVTLTSSMGTTPATSGTYGHIIVDDAVTWSANTTLTLNADNNIYVNAPITGTGAASGLNLIAFIDVNINEPSALNTATVTVTAGTPTIVTNVNINAPQTWTTAHAWTFTGNLNINAPVTWNGTAPLTVTSTNMLNINAAMTGTAANSELVLAASDINFNVANALNVRTLAANASNNVNIGLGQTLTPGSSWSLNAAQAININAPLTAAVGTTLALNAETNINVNAPSALNVALLTAVAGNDINVNAAQTWTTAHPWTFTGNLNINAAVNWTGSTPLNLSATRAINVNATMGGSDPNSALVLHAGTDINVAAVNAFNVGTLNAIGGNAVNIAGRQTWTTSGNWTFAGDTVNVNGAVNWSAGALTLNAARNVFVNAVMSATGTASFAANYGHALDANGNPTATVTPGNDAGHTPGINADTTPMGLYMALTSRGTYAGRIDFSSTGSLRLGGQTYSVINSVTALDAITGNLSRNYALGSSLSNLNLTDLPSASLFTGNFNGLGHALSLAPVSTLSINSPLAIAPLRNTNVVLAATGDININTPVVSGADVLTFAAGNSINLNAPISGGNTGSFAFDAPAMTIGQSVTVAGANIYLNSPITWSSDAVLTLTANRDININRSISASGTNAGLAMNYGGNYNILTLASYSGAVLDANGHLVADQAPAGTQYASINLSGSNASLSINGNAYTLIRSMSDLDLLDGQNSVDGSGTLVTPTGNYALVQDLDASGTTFTRALIATFGGTLAGLGHTISNLTINAPTTPNIGLAGQSLAGSTFRDIGLVNASVTGRGSVGTLLGFGTNTTIANVYATGSVVATGFNGTTVLAGNGSNAGGLVARLTGGSLTSSYANVSVTGFNSTGGLIGNATNATVTRSHAEGNVTITPNFSGNPAGGLIGAATNTTISNTYATGDVFGSGFNHGGLIGTLGNGGSLSYSFATGDVGGGTVNQNIGGLVGTNNGASLNYVYATGNVSGLSSVGGLVGLHTSNSLTGSRGFISNAYATGNVTGTSSLGGFVGSNSSAGVISSAYATGTVTGDGVYLGGFAGTNAGFISRAYATGAVGALGSPGPVGGFAGLNAQAGTIENSYSTGNVSGSSTVGGVVGENGGLISRSWATGNIAGTVTENGGGIGGVAGKHTGNIVESIFAGRIVSGTGAVGGIVGWAPVGNISDSHFNGDLNPGMSTVGSNPNLRNQSTTRNSGAASRAELEEMLRRLRGDSSGGGGEGSGESPIIDTGAQTGQQPAPHGEQQTGAQQAAQQAATRQALINQASQAVNSAVSNSTTLSPFAPGVTMPAAVAPAPNLDANITVREPPAQQMTSFSQPLTTGGVDRRRRARKGNEPGFRATIRSIEVDGRRFDIEKLDSEKSTPPAAQPAPTAPR